MMFRFSNEEHGTYVRTMDDVGSLLGLRDGDGIKFVPHGYTKRDGVTEKVFAATDGDKIIGHLHALWSVDA